MSVRCKVCNAPKIVTSDQTKSNVYWECQTCGNTVDSNGHVVSLE